MFVMILLNVDLGRAWKGKTRVSGRNVMYFDNMAGEGMFALLKHVYSRVSETGIIDLDCQDYWSCELFNYYK